MNIKIKKANYKNIDDIMKIYKSLIGFPGCAWNDIYPNKEIIQSDINCESMYIVYYNDLIVAVANASKDEELENLKCWNKSIENPCGLARIGVLEKYQNKGIAKELIKYIEKDVTNCGFDGIHFLVSKTNPHAKAVYDKMNYICCGECIMYDKDCYCYEKKLK